MTGDRFPLSVNTARVDGRPVSTSPVDGNVMETGHPSIRAVNSGSGNRALDPSSAYRAYTQVDTPIQGHNADIVKVNVNVDLYSAMS